jgi:hypothetical protein
MRRLFSYFRTLLSDFLYRHYLCSVSPAAPAAVLAALLVASVTASGAAVAAAWVAPGRPPPLYEGFWLLAPRPRCEGGSCTESQSGGGPGLGIGGGGVGCPLATSFFPAGARAGMTDSRRVRLEAGSPSCPPWARSAISFLASTLLAFKVRWIPSPAQMLAPSTVVRSWGRDSQEPKKLRMLINLAFPVRSPAAAASNKLFQLQRIWRRILRIGG